MKLNANINTLDTKKSSSAEVTETIHQATGNVWLTPHDAETKLSMPLDSNSPVYLYVQSPLSIRV